MMSLIVQSTVDSRVQWNLDLTKWQGTGEIGSLYRGFVISKTTEKQQKCSLYRDKDDMYFLTVSVLRCLTLHLHFHI